MSNPEKWDIWIWVIWVLTAGSAIGSTFLIMRCGIITETMITDNASIIRTSYDYPVIFGLIGLTLVLLLLTVCCSMINDDLKNTIDFYRQDGVESDQGPLPDSSRHQLASDEFADGSKALKVLRMSLGSPLLGTITDKAIIYHINDISVSTAAEANAALIEGSNTIQWKDARGNVKTSEIVVHDRDLKAEFEQRHRS